MKHSGLFDSADAREPAPQSCARQACSFAARDRWAAHISAHISAHRQEAKAAAGGVETWGIFTPPAKTLPYFPSRPRPPPPPLPWRGNISRICADKIRASHLRTVFQISIRYHRHTSRGLRRQPPHPWLWGN